MRKENTVKYKEEWIKLYNEGLSFREIGRRYGYAMSTVKQRISDSVIKRDKNENDKYHEIWGKLYENGFTLTQIGDVYGVSKCVIRRVLVKYGYINNILNRGKYNDLKEDMVKMYRGGYSLREIAEKFNLSKQTVLNYIKFVDEGVIRDYSSSLRVYNYNEDYFEELTEESAFTLGLLIKTSFIINEKSRRLLRMGFSGGKKDVIDCIARNINFKEIKYNYNEKEKFFRPEIFGSKIIDNLSVIGVRTKGQDYNKVNIPEKYISNFLDGYIYACYKELKNCIAIQIVDLIEEEEFSKYMESLNIYKYLFVDKKTKKMLNINNEDKDKFLQKISDIKLRYEI